MILLVIHTFNPVLHGWMQFPWIPDDPLMYVWLLCGFLQPPRSIAQPPPSYVKRVYIPMHSVQPSHWMVEITSSIYTFLHVPCYPSIESLKSCPESIRSCTFCATLPIILCHRVLNLYVPIRSVQPSHKSMKLVYDLTRSDTFRTHASCFLNDLIKK